VLPPIPADLSLMLRWKMPQPPPKMAYFVGSLVDDPKRAPRSANTAIGEDALAAKAKDAPLVENNFTSYGVLKPGNTICWDRFFDYRAIVP